MKRFKFNFESLLNLTISLEKEQKNKLAVVNNELSILNSNRMEILFKIKDLNNYIINALTVDELINSNNYLTYLKDKLININMQISIKEEEKSQIQAELIEIMTKRKTYEKLKKKQLEIYKKELEAEDMKQLSDFISGNGGV